MSQERAEPSMGEFIRRQRELAALPMRQLAAMVGISNPYLSQIERGLREPSERVLSAIADSLQLSADALSAQAAQSRAGSGTAVVDAINEDTDLTNAQRKALIEMYTALRELTVSKRRRVRGDGRAPSGGSVAG